MDRPDKRERLDRHALVVTVWAVLGFVAAVMFQRGSAADGIWWIVAGVAVVLAAFAVHVIANAVYRTSFTVGELALGLVVYALALMGFGVAVLVSPGFREAFLLPVSLGFLAVFAAVLFFMLTAFGVRRPFEAFDRIRDFRSAGGLQGRNGDTGR